VVEKARGTTIGFASGRSPDADPGSPFGWRNLLKQGLHIIPIASDEGLITQGARDMLDIFRDSIKNGDS